MNFIYSFYNQHSQEMHELLNKYIIINVSSKMYLLIIFNR